MAGFLSRDEQMILKEAHRAAQDKRHAYKINAVLLLHEGWSYEQIATALLLDETTARRYLKIYQRKGLDGLLDNLYEGRNPKLATEQIVELKGHLQQVIYPNAKSIAAYVAKTHGVTYTPEGLTHLIHRLGFVYKKTKAVPGKADPEKQKAFLETYHRLKEQKGPNDRIYFMDGCHPNHNAMPAYGWIAKGVIKEIPTNTARQRINLNGAIDVSDFDLVIREDPTLNAQSTIALFKQIEEKNPLAKAIYMIADNAPYYRSKLIKEHLQDSKIKILFLPSYSPNLNLIERLWKFFHKTVQYNQYYSTFDRFKEVSLNFFANIKDHHEALRSLLTENFQIIGLNVSQSQFR
jgi:transposase